MALTDASRTSELQALDLHFRRFRPERVYFTLASLTKKRSTSNTHCVVQCLRQYEKVNKDICPRDNSEANPLFLSYINYINPHWPITSWRVAHWIKDVLREAGVDTNTFKAHLVQGASTTASLMKGISFRRFSVQRIGALSPHFRDFIIDMKRRMSMLAPY